MSKISIIFLMTFIGGIGSTIAFDASWGICLWIVEYFFHPKIRWWYNQLPELRYSFLIILSILISFLVRRKQYSSNELLKLPQAKWIVLLVTMCLMIQMWAAWPEMHKLFSIAFAKLVIVIALFYKVVDTPKKLNRCIWAYMIGAFYIGWVGYGTGRTFGGRLEGIGFTDGMDVNAVAAAIASVIPLTLYHAFYEKKIVLRGISILFLPFMLNLLVLANSRGGFLGLIFGCGYFFFRIYFSSLPPSLKKRNEFILMALCSIGLFFYLADDAFWERMSLLGKATEQVPLCQDSCRMN
jgi:hypothetical protein